MWQSRTLRSFGISAFLWPVLWALCCALGSSSAGAATSEHWTATGCNAGTGCPYTTAPYASPNAAGQDVLAYLNANCAVEAGVCNVAAGCTAAHPCSFSQGSGWVFATFPTFGSSATITFSGGASGSLGITFAVIGNTTPGACAAAGTSEDIYTQAGITGSVCGSDGCLYAAGPSTFIVNSPPGTHYLQTVVSQGNNCAVSAATVPTQSVSPGTTAAAGACQQGSTGVTACDEQPQVGPGCGSFNGDQVCVQSVPSGSCVAYASGGVACVSTAAAEPGGPAPNNGTPNVAATPAGQVTYNSSTVNYYTSSQNTSSTAAATTVSANNPAAVGMSGSSGSGGGGSGTVAVSSVGGTVSVAGTVAVAPNAANGDCGASGVNCTGASLTGTSWSGDCADFTACLEGFYTSVSAAPILSGATAIESSWPAGSCDIGSVSLATFNGQSFNYGTQACAVWTNYIQAPLTAILLVVYAVAGVFLVLSA